MRIRHLLLRERIASAFICSDLVNVGIDAEFIERSTKEHHVRGQADREQLARRRHENLVARGRDVIVLIKAHLHVRVDRFARRTKVCDRAANFFRLGPAGFRHINVQHHAGDPLINFRFAKLSEQAAERLGLRAEDATKRIVRNVIRQRAGNSQRQHTVVLNRRAIAAQGGHHERDAEHHEHHEPQHDGRNNENDLAGL